MKKVKIMETLALALVFCTAIQACGQNDDAPTNVKGAFAKKFPNVKKVKWEKENATEWEAEFKMKGTEYSANFTEDGTWKETEHEIKKSAIPAHVKSTLDTEFAGYKIEEAEISETDEGSIYEFGIEKGEQSMEVAIDTDGKVATKEMKEEGDEDND